MRTGTECLNQASAGYQANEQGIFLYIGAILPWGHFGEWYGITPWRLVVLGILVMLVRRLPWVVALVRYTLSSYSSDQMVHLQTCHSMRTGG